MSVQGWSWSQIWILLLTWNKKDGLCLGASFICNDCWRRMRGNWDRAVKWKCSIVRISDSSQALPVLEISSLLTEVCQNSVCSPDPPDASPSFHDSSTLELLQKCVVPAVLYQTKAPSSEVTSLCQQRGKDIWRNSLWTWAFRGWFLWCMDIHFVYYVYVCICSDSLFHTLILKMKCIFKNFLCYSKLITLLFYLELFNPCVKQNNRIIICYSLVIFPCSLMFRPSCFLRPVSLPMCSSLVSHIWPRKEVLSLTPFFLAFVLSFAQPELWDLAPAVSLP